MLVYLKDDALHAGDGCSRRRHGNLAGPNSKAVVVGEAYQTAVYPPLLSA